MPTSAVWQIDQILFAFKCILYRFNFFAWELCHGLLQNIFLHSRMKTVSFFIWIVVAVLALLLRCPVRVYHILFIERWKSCVRDRVASTADAEGMHCPIFDDLANGVCTNRPRIHSKRHASPQTMWFIWMQARQHTHAYTSLRIYAAKRLSD